MTTTRTHPRARFADLLAAEWLKFWSVRSTRWGVLVGALVVVGMNVNAAFNDYRNWPEYTDGLKAGFVPGWAINDAFTNGAASVTALAVGALGAMAVAGEYGTGMIRTTFAAVPARRAVMAAKLTVNAAVFTGYGAVVAGVSFWSTQAILAGRDAGLSIAYPDAIRAVTASALLAPVCALVGMGVAALVRHPATSLVITVALLLVAPFLLSEKHAVTAALLHALPYQAWNGLTMIEPGGLDWLPYPPTVTGAWLSYAGWSLGAVLAALIVVRRDP